MLYRVDLGDWLMLSLTSSALFIFFLGGFSDLMTEDSLNSSFTAIPLISLILALLSPVFVIQYLWLASFTTDLVSRISSRSSFLLCLGFCGHQTIVFLTFLVRPWSLAIKYSFPFLAVLGLYLTVLPCTAASFHLWWLYYHLRDLQKYTVNNCPPRVDGLSKTINTDKSHFLQLSPGWWAWCPLQKWSVPAMLLSLQNSVPVLQFQ